MRTAVMRSLSVAASLALALLIVSCGSSTTPRGAQSAHQATSPTPDPRASATTSPTTTSQTATGAGQVTLALSKQHYDTEEPLLVTIHNDLRTSIWVRDGQAGCTSLVAERLDQGAWEPVGQCTPASPVASLIAIAPGSALTQRLDAAQGMDTGAGWPASTYRVMLQYGLDGTTGAITEGPTTYSPEFIIG